MVAADWSSSVKHCTLIKATNESDMNSEGRRDHARVHYHCVDYYPATKRKTHKLLLFIHIDLKDTYVFKVYFVMTS